MPSARTRRAVAILAALAISASVGACGSDDDDGGSSGSDTRAREPLSRDAYLEQLNAAQTAFADGAAKLHLPQPSSAKDLGAMLDELSRLIDTLRTRFDDMVPPDVVAAQQDELVLQLRDYGDAIERQKGALTSGNAQEATAASRSVDRASTAFARDFDATIGQINKNFGLQTGAPSPSD